jgi:hypothetical protein
MRWSSAAEISRPRLAAAAMGEGPPKGCASGRGPGWRAAPGPAPDPARLGDAGGDHDVGALQALAARRDARPIGR